MAATEELRVLIRTVADTSGVKQASGELKQLTAQQEAANRVMRQAMVAAPHTLPGFQTQLKAVQQQIGAMPTLGPKAFGIDDQGAQSARATTAEFTKLGVAAGVAGIAAGQLAGKLGDVVSIFSDSTQVAREHERVIRATALAYGQAAGQYQEFAQQLSTTTGFTSDAILEAALSARTLSQNYGLSIQQTQKLIAVSADLARVRGIGVAEAFERIQSAIRGEAEASEYLGLTLNDTYLTNQAMNGSLKNSFGTMTDLQKAQVRYAEVLKQTQQFAGLASTATDSLDAAFGRAENSGRKLQTVLGEITKPATITGMNTLAKMASNLAEALKGDDPGAVRFRVFLEELGKGGSLVGSAQTAQARVEGERLRALERARDLQANMTEDTTKSTQAIRQQLVAQQDATRRAADLTNRRLLEQNTTFLPQLDNAQATARLAFLDQVDAAVRDVLNAQQEQVELQRRSVDLAATEAQLRLGMLPAQERMAAAQRDVAEAQIRARQAALPASEALEDLRYEQERARLVVQNRNTSVDERIAARRELRQLSRAEPATALSALQAGRGVTLAGRAAERVGLDAQLFGIQQERALAQVRLAEETNSLLATIAGQKTQAIELTINLTSEEFQTLVYKQLIEANKQAQGPTTIPQSGARR